MKLHILLYSLIILAFFISCKKFLDVKNDTKNVVPTKLEDLQMLLDDSSLMNASTPSFGQASCDEYFVEQDGYDNTGLANRNSYILERFDYVWDNDWSKGYMPVYNSNLCLEQIQKIPRGSHNATQWDNVTGSAFFFRAYSFLNLVWTFSKAYDSNSATNDLGIVLRKSSDFHVTSVRSNLKDTYEQIIKDALDAARYLPDHPTHVMRPSKAAAYCLLARVYLSMRDYENALKYADLCLKIKSGLMDYNINNGSWNIEASTPFQKFNSETIFYSEMTNTYGFANSISAYGVYVDTVLVAMYSQNDLRKIAFLESVGKYYRFKGNYSSGSEMFSGMATDEVYLTRAECYARSGNRDAALQDLNTLLSKRFSGVFVPLVAPSSEQALALILIERRKELLQRGLRWMDIKRLNKEGFDISIIRNINGKTYTLPANHNRFALTLPKDIVDLTGIPQNP